MAMKRETRMAQPTIRGVYRKGRIRLLEPAPVSSDSPVLVVFLDNVSEDAERKAWLDATRRRFLKGYARRDSAYDAL